MSLIKLTASALADKLSSGEVSSVEATQEHLDRIAAVDGDVHAFLHISSAALETAAEVDRKRAAGEKLGPLAGVPVAIKDVLCTIDMPSTAAMRSRWARVASTDDTSPEASLSASAEALSSMSSTVTAPLPEWPTP